MKQLESINTKLKNINAELIEFANSLELEFVCEFNMENCNEIPWENINCKGIYFIEIKNNYLFEDFKTWAENFRKEWEDEMYKKKFVPNLKKIRINKLSELNEWIPLYIGKSKKIKSRVYEHIHKELGKPTFALKLNSRQHIKKETFRLSILKVDTENYDWVMPVFEKTLRDKLNPIIGRQ